MDHLFVASTTYGPPVCGQHHTMDPTFGAWPLCWGTAIAAQWLWFADSGHGGTYAQQVNHF